MLLKPFLNLIFFALVVTQPCTATPSNDSILSVSGQSRGIFSNLFNKTVNYAKNQLNGIECKSADEIFGFALFKKIVGHDVSFGNEIFCNSTCTGRCVPNQQSSREPQDLPSKYAFRCECPTDKCSLITGPVVRKNFPSSMYETKCVREPLCNCFGMDNLNSTDTNKVSHIGYLCQWSQVNDFTSNTTTSYSETVINGLLSKMQLGSWCACCPATTFAHIIDTILPYLHHK